MQWRNIISKRIRHHEGGANVASDVNAVVAANVNEPGGAQHTSVKSKQRIVQSSTRSKSDQAEGRE